MFKSYLLQKQMFINEMICLQSAGDQKMGEVYELEKLVTRYFLEKNG